MRISDLSSDVCSSVLGFGLALPFLLLAYVPSLRTRLPRPGPWMGTFQKILSVPMFLTAVGLLWMLVQQRGVPAMTIGLATALLLALLLRSAERHVGDASVSTCRSRLSEYH